MRKTEKTGRINARDNIMRKLWAVVITGGLAAAIGLIPGRVWCQASAPPASAASDPSPCPLTKATNTRQAQSNTSGQHNNPEAETGKARPDADAEDRSLASQRFLPVEVLWSPLSIDRLTANN